MVNRRYFINIIVSIGISLLLLGLLISGVSGSTDAALRPKLLSILSHTSLGFIGLYVVTSFIQTFFRALRYGVILKTSGESVPGKFHLFLISMSRNMFVDMLPARLGELSYIGMLNRGFKVGADACLSSLVISFVFDIIALALLILVLIGYQVLFADLQPWIVGTCVMVMVLSAGLLVFLFPFLQWLTTQLLKFQISHRGVMGKVMGLLESTVDSLQQARQGKIVGKVLSLSIGVRIFKYLGLYLIFLGVVLPSFPDIERDVSSVLIALVSAEASASMPVPSFMSFGTYEAGGAFALIALGAAKAISVIVMLALHIWSQIIDYGLGIGATIFFIFIVSARSESTTAKTSGRGKFWIFFAALLLCAGLVFFAFELRSVKKLGSFKPPKPGQPVLAAGMQRPSDPILAKLNGFVIWSSNRFGNHDLVMLTLPDQQLTRLTTDPHTEYFPRISPDGSKVVFCRSREPWVSQRNYFAWDVYLLDLPSGEISLLAENGNVPTWSSDGRAVYFQRRGNQFVEHTLAGGKERILFETGKNLPLDASVLLETPAWNKDRQALAVTLRGGSRGTAVIDSTAVRPVGDGCELNWSPDGSFLYYVDHGGRGGNAFYRVNPENLSRQLWYDAPGEYSHEYFPKLANSGDVLVFGASSGGHEHDQADYEIFLWPVGSPMDNTARLSFHTGNDNWPDIYLY
jgi:hypothetical protein